VFYNFLGAYTLVTSLPGLFFWLPEWVAPAFGWGAAVAGPAALWFMHAIYRIPARPFWNHWQVLTAFYGNMFALGAVAVGVPWLLTLAWTGEPVATLVRALAVVALTGLVMEAVGLWFHVRYLKRIGGEGEASHYEQTTTFGKTWLARNTGLALAATACLLLALFAPEGSAGAGLWTLTGLLIVAVAVVGRALFYVLVVPTTMPGAFFWRNQGFQEHAREVGLARMPQVGVVADVH
jgi:DMSO reductase anchor subunit